MALKALPIWQGFFVPAIWILPSVLGLWLDGILNTKSPAKSIGGAFELLLRRRRVLQGRQQSHADAHLYSDDQHAHGTGKSQGQHAARGAVVVRLGLLAALPHQRHW